MDDQQNNINQEKPQDKTAPTPTEKHCYNCATIISQDAKFCSNCGQKHTTGKIPIYEFVYDFFKNVFNIDAKLPKTLLNLLFFPGRLTTRFFEGKHKSYLKPTQLFVSITLLCFTIILFQANGLNKKWSINGEQKGFDSGIKYNEGENNLHRLMAIDTAQYQIDSLLNVVKTTANSNQITAIIDTTFQTWLAKDVSLLDSMIIPISLTGGKTETIKIDKRDLVLYTEKELVKKYNIEGFIPKMLFIQVLKSVRHEDQLMNHFLGRLSWTFFLLVPFFAFILKLVYIRRKQFYVEHLVFTFHFHALAFTLISLFLLLRNYLPDYIRLPLLGYIPIYLFLSMKGFYKQGIFKTLFKYILLIFSYIILFVVTLMITMAIVFVLF